MRNLRILIITLILVVNTALVQAAVIYLKEGGIVEGKIIDRKSYYVTVMKNNVPRKIYTSRIEKIIEDDDFGSNPLGMETKSIEGISPRKSNLILNVLEANGTLAAMRKNMDQVVGDVPPEKKKKLERIFNINEIVQRVVPIYDQYYTEEDLQNIINFYQSPTGKKVTENSSSILEESMQANLQYFQDKLGQ